ncbi:hypothetical protein P154DRAFT_574428 [Amniculicola lignicola CBS 123094]|uniref:Anaphase-promoting complex subunit 11 n=1 Tax=Amniculicola lignicola CBS 123094 TaxID=1392246 RepID=A0A6A5WMK2_9PLEO|nr:hypothetical protein P154DRAFT_574428 [Amniculicola lignicola CBS 123094]
MDAFLDTGVEVLADDHFATTSTVCPICKEASVLANQVPEPEIPYVHEDGLIYTPVPLDDHLDSTIMHPTDMVVKILLCGHIYHAYCLSTWLRSLESSRPGTCPMDRRVLYGALSDNRLEDLGDLDLDDEDVYSDAGSGPHFEAVLTLPDDFSEDWAAGRTYVLATIPISEDWLAIQFRQNGEHILAYLTRDIALAVPAIAAWIEENPELQEEQEPTEPPENFLPFFPDEFMSVLDNPFIEIWRVCLLPHNMLWVSWTEHGYRYAVIEEWDIAMRFAAVESWMNDLEDRPEEIMRIGQAEEGQRMSGVFEELLATPGDNHFAATETLCLICKETTAEPPGMDASNANNKVSESDTPSPQTVVKLTLCGYIYPSPVSQAGSPWSLATFRGPHDNLGDLESWVADGRAADVEMECLETGRVVVAWKDGEKELSSVDAGSACEEGCVLWVEDGGVEWGVETRGAIALMEEDKEQPYYSKSS